MADDLLESAKPSEVEVKPHLNILYIDDDIGLHKLFKMGMKTFGGHEVQSFSSQEEFIEYFENLDEKDLPDVVVSDVNLTGDVTKREGLGLLSIVKSRNPKIKTAILSGYADQLRGLDLPDIDLKISKPFEARDIVIQLNGLFSTK